MPRPTGLATDAAHAETPVGRRLRGDDVGGVTFRARRETRHDWNLSEDALMSEQEYEGRRFSSERTVLQTRSFAPSSDRDADGCNQRCQRVASLPPKFYFLIG